MAFLLTGQSINKFIVSRNNGYKEADGKYFVQSHYLWVTPYMKDMKCTCNILKLFHKFENYCPRSEQLLVSIME